MFIQASTSDGHHNTSQNHVEGRLRKRITQTPRNSSQLSQHEMQANTPQRRVGIGNWISEAAPRVWTNLAPKNPDSGHVDEPTQCNDSGRERKSMISIPRLGESRGRDDRATHRRATVHYSSTGRPSVMGSKRL